MRERISLFVLAVLMGGSSVAQAGAENCREVRFKSLTEVIELFVKSGVERVSLVKSAFTPATLTVFSATDKGELRQKSFSTSSVADESNRVLWERAPEFDYDDLPASLNTSCGYGHVNYTVAYTVGETALCYMLNPKSSVLGRKGQLEACLIVPEDIHRVLDQVRRQFPEKFR